MRTKTTIVQKLPHEYKRKIIEFHKYVINMRKKLCFEIGQLGNMDDSCSYNHMYFVSSIIVSCYKTTYVVYKEGYHSGNITFVHTSSSITFHVTEVVSCKVV